MTDFPTAPKPLTWPEPGQPLPPPDEVLAPLLESFAARFKLARKANASSGAYAGLPVTIDTCADPAQFTDSAHAKIRAEKGLPLAGEAELFFLQAFLLGQEHARRSGAGRGVVRGQQQRVRRDREGSGEAQREQRRARRQW